MPCRVNQGATLATAALFGSTGLKVDKNRHIAKFAQVPLETVHLGAVVETGQGRVVAPRHGGDVIRYQCNALNAFGSADVRN